MSYSANALDLLSWSKDQTGVEALPIWVMDSGRLNEKRPAYLKVAAPDNWVRNLTGKDDHDVYVMVRIPQEAHELWAATKNSPGSLKAAMGVKESSGNNIGDSPVVDEQKA